MTKLIIRYIFLGLISTCFCLPLHSQTKLHKLTVDVDFHDFGFYHEYWNQIDLVSNDTVIKAYLSKAYKYLKIDSIPSGTYQVRLLSVFNHVIIDTVKFDKRISKQIKFDDLANYYEILDKESQFCQNMHDSDTLVILYSETGCFHSDFGKMQFIRTSNSWIAQLYNPLTGNLIKQRVIRIEDFSKVGTFERYVNQNKDSFGCTTVAYYSLQFKKQIVRFTDGSCSWDGFKKLKTDIFGTD